MTISCRRSLEQTEIVEMIYDSRGGILPEENTGRTPPALWHPKSVKKLKKCLQLPGDDGRL